MNNKKIIEQKLDVSIDDCKSYRIGEYSDYSVLEISPNDISGIQFISIPQLNELNNSLNGDMDLCVSKTDGIKLCIND